MPPIIHLVRHAQGYHNLSSSNHTMPDPSLTPHGVSQCHTLTTTFSHHSRVTLLVASPLRRTIYTALHAFPSQVSDGLMVIALPEIQETSDLPCDTGSDIEILKEEFKDKPVDLSLVRKGWDSKQGRWAATTMAIEARAREARIWLRGREEEEVVVVTHGGFVHFLTEDWTDSRRFEGTGWENCEYRSYAFSADALDDNATMTEVAESRSRRHGTEKPLTTAERIQLRETAMKTWENAGYQHAKQAASKV